MSPPSRLTTILGGPCWASLPPDLAAHIADCLLATNDIDYYMDFRAVCRDWRHATDDPTNTWDVRFRPCQWIVFRADGSDTTHLFVNTATGRFQRKDMPLLSKYHQVAAAKGGFLVLVDKVGPAPLFVLNPFTGYLARFIESSTTAFGVMMVAAAVLGSPPTLVLCQMRHGQHKADLDGNHITVLHENLLDRHVIWLAIGNGVYNLMGCPFLDVPLLKMFSSDQMKMFSKHRGFLVECDGEASMVVKRQNGGGMEVFKVDADGVASEPVKSIGDDRAIFVGICKCGSVDASKFSSINGNCIYYVRTEDTYPYNEMIYRYDMKEEKEEMVCRKAGNMAMYDGTIYDRGSKITRLLSSYTASSPYLAPTCTWEELSL